MLYDLSGIPSELKEARRWLIWRKIEDPGNPDKFVKSPVTGGVSPPKYTYDYNDARNLRCLQWALDEIPRQEKKTNCKCGLGYSLTEDLAVIDLDDVRNVAGKIFDERALAILDSVGDTYVESSQSGTGIHIWTKARIPKSYTKPYEILTKGRYVSVTGFRLTECTTVKPKQDEVDGLLERYNFNIKTIENKKERPPEAKTNGVDRSKNISAIFCNKIKLGWNKDEIIKYLAKTPYRDYHRLKDPSWVEYTYQWAKDRLFI